MDLKIGTGRVSIPLKAKTDLETAKAMLQERAGGINVSGLRRHHLEKVIEAHEAGISDEKEFVFELPVIALGNLVLAGFPESGLRMDRMLPVAKLLTVSCVNGRHGYFVTEDVLCRGGYEVNMFYYDRLQPYVDNADFALAKGSAEEIRKIISEQ